MDDGPLSPRHSSLLLLSFYPVIVSFSCSTFSSAIMSATTCASLLLPLVFVATVWTAIDDRCNEAVCASIVSKCQLLQRCSCDRGNSSCTLDCFKCLDYLYMECCSCVSICPKANETDPLISTQSHAEHLSEPLPSLFTTLTQEEDQLLRWTTYSFPVQVSFVTTSGNDPKENTFGADTRVTFKDDGFDEEEDVQVKLSWTFFLQVLAHRLPFLSLTDKLHGRIHG